MNKPYQVTITFTGEREANDFMFRLNSIVRPEGSRPPTMQDKVRNVNFLRSAVRSGEANIPEYPQVIETPKAIPELVSTYIPGDSAEAAGFAQFNGGPHLCVEVPNNHFTVSAKTTEGKRITFAFVPYKEDGAAQCVDVKYHDSPAPRIPNGDMRLSVMHSVGFTVGHDTYDTRRMKEPTTLITVLLSDEDYKLIQSPQ
jgi:hypothetical protein